MKSELKIKFKSDPIPEKGDSIIDKKKDHVVLISECYNDDTFSGVIIWSKDNNTRPVGEPMDEYSLRDYTYFKGEILLTQ